MESSDRTIVVRFHSHLRLADHPALDRAVERADRIVPIYVADGRGERWGPGPNQAHWRVESLRALGQRLERFGLDLVVRRGDLAEELREVVTETGADAVYWNRRYRPDQRRRDREASEALRERGVDYETFESQLLHEPEAIETSSGGPYHVFTPFWRKFLEEVTLPAPLPVPPLDGVSPPETSLASLTPSDLERDGDIAPAFEDWWQPGEKAAQGRLTSFVAEGLEQYPEGRDALGVSGTSRLSPRLQHGELSPRQVWEAVAEEGMPDPEAEGAPAAFLRQIVWREFSYHLLHHYPRTPTQPLKGKFRAFGWRDDGDVLERWRRGRTGYPVVDAGMRQLLQIGWMHNRARMIVASFLTKDLRQHWLRGAEWFWHNLVDADLANNTMGWQWAAGSGADAQPFFRIFNPVSQGERHDPDGEYVRRYIPELAELPDDYIHKPWQAPAAVLEEAGVELGGDYPRPMVEHSAARERALEEWRRIK